MDKKQQQFVTYVMEDVLGHLPNITSRAMFGGHGIYQDGIIFALIAYNQLYFKVGENNIKDYKQADSKPFTYKQGKHKETSMSYWLVPEEVLNSKQKTTSWVKKAVSASKARKK